MDRKTLGAYDHDAAAFATEWEAQPAAFDIHDLVLRYFEPGLTADIGCGSGRETEWLARNGFPATGYDASEALLTEAHRLHPGIEFKYATLPDLSGVPDQAFRNVFCETVIMHLPPEAIAPSVRRLLAILQPGGTLYLSWRVTEGSDKRDNRGRLYSAFDPALVFESLASETILLNERRVSESSGKEVRRVVARKSSANRS
jgi:2-polyprenyl-3-methyl-5-hydroxy-6-metoxy-1,4-benzoquinol methylase